jgi:hypothetical protein
MKPADLCTVVGWPASGIAHTFLRKQEILLGNRNARQLPTGQVQLEWGNALTH